MEDNRRKMEVKFVFDDVRVYILIPHEDEALFTGKLIIINEHHGAIIEWHPAQLVDDKIQNPRLSPETENLDWEDVSSPVVEYRPNKISNTDPVEIKPPAQLPRAITFDVSAVKSFRRLKSVKDNEIIISFFLKDGETVPSLYFETKTFEAFLNALNTYVTFKKSKKDESLYLCNDSKMEALEKSFSELDLFEDNKPHIVRKFFQEPYATALGSFSKVTNFLFDYVVYNGGTASPTQYSENMAALFSENFIDVQQEDQGFEIITCVEMPERPEIKRLEPVTLEEWQSHIDSDGRLCNVEDLKKKIFKGGLVHSVRSEVWKFLLGYYGFDSTYKEREQQKKIKIDDYYRMKLQWKSMTSDQESKFTALRERKSLIEKDVSRTDRTHPFFEGDNNINLQMLYDILMTYCMYNFDLGYVQGMSDLLSPLLVVMQNEADTFWCFAGWLENIGLNFELDQQGMKTQLLNLHRLIHFIDPQLCSYLEDHESGNLYFCFRWLLILFKRDFKFQEIMRLWEVMWTELPCKNFHLLICIAILETEKVTIMESNFGLNEILKHINDLSYKINLDETLCKAEAIYEQIKNCSITSDVIENILSLEGPFGVGNEAKVNGTEIQPVIPGVMTQAPSRSDERKAKENFNPVSCESNVDDYVDLEQQYQISFGLFT